MSKIQQDCVQIDNEIVLTRRFAQEGGTYKTMMSVARLGDLIQLHRDDVEKELVGLRGDVKSAESAYEREKVKADGLEQEKDRWTNECLPGWRKRVTEAERKERETRAAYDSNVAELKALALHAGDLEQDRDEWKKQALEFEDKYLNLKAHGYSSASDGGDLNQGEPLYAAIDPGSKEGDKTVISWVCTCGTAARFQPPKVGLWTHDAPCSCGALTKLNYAE